MNDILTKFTNVANTLGLTEYQLLAWTILITASVLLITIIIVWRIVREQAWYEGAADANMHWLGMSKNEAKRILDEHGYYHNK